MIINYDLLDLGFDDNTLYSKVFKKSNRHKLSKSGVCKKDFHTDNWYDYNNVEDCVYKNYAKIKGILRQNIGKPFWNVRSEIVKKIAHSDYEKYLIKDYIDHIIFKSKYEIENTTLLKQGFYKDDKKCLRYFQRNNKHKNNNKEYGYFLTSESYRKYIYYINTSSYIEDAFKELTHINLKTVFGNNVNKTFSEEEVNKYCEQYSNIIYIIKLKYPAQYKFYINKNHNYINDNKLFCKNVLFNAHCINPTIKVEKNSSDYFKYKKLHLFYSENINLINDLIKQLK